MQSTAYHTAPFFLQESKCDKRTFFQQVYLLFGGFSVPVIVWYMKLGLILSHTPDSVYDLS